MENQTATPKPKAPAELSCTELLAGVSIGTIAVIKHASDESIAILPNGPDENGKYSAWLMLAVGDKIQPRISTKPMFDTPESAVELMKRVIKAAREIDLVGKPANDASERTPTRDEK